MANEKVLVVDDEEDILELLSHILSKEGYKVRCAVSGEEALARVKSEIPDLIVLDLMLPGIDGFEVARRLKEDAKTSHLPIIMLTAKTEESDVVTGLEIGAHDYVTKPFSPKVLIARMRAVLRRMDKGENKGKTIVRIHDLVIHQGHRKVTLNGRPVQLTLAEFGILHFLASAPGWVFSRSEIVDAVHGEDYSVTDRSVDVQIVGLRKKLGKAGQYIETVRGVGYRLKE